VTVLIILEGPDGAGKSTLAREIVDILQRDDKKVELLHAGPLGEHPLDAYELPLAHYRPGRDSHIVCDRWHLGEAVYPRVFERPTLWDPAVAGHIDMFLEARGALVIVLNPRWEELRTRVAIRGDDLIDPIQLEYISTCYRRLPRRFVSRTYEKFVSPREIIATAQQFDETVMALNAFETYAGPLNPQVLLLGDQREPLARSKRPGLPAFVPFRTTSGHYLLKHVLCDFETINPVLCPRLGIANACDADDPVALWRVLGHPKIVTLGERAHKKLVSLGLEHGAAPHPQFVRRFYFKYGRSYASLISDAARTQKDMRTWRPY
jgi:thymidylate kinase